MYLKIDYTGPASGEHYGNRGDAVTLIPTTGFNTMVLVERNGKRFWLMPDDLTEEKPMYDNESKKDSPAPEAVKKGTGRIQPLRKNSRRR